MLPLLLQGHFQIVALLLLAIIASLSLHEFGHAFSAKLLGDDTAEKMGRMTLNPVAHIDILGLLMVVFVGFGYAKPVPVNHNRLKYAWAGAAVAAAGPLMNLLLAIASVNFLIWAHTAGLVYREQASAQTLMMLANINLSLMVFNLIPLGPLDGHYIMSWLLSPSWRVSYERFNTQYGSQIFMGLIMLSIIGVPVFSFLNGISAHLLQLLSFM